jgi:predicted TPR repeat methyltransferase
MSSLPSLNEALALMNQQAFAAARSICQQHLAHKPDDFNARHLLGLIQLKSGNAIAACRELQRATELPVQARFKAQALSNLSLALQARGRSEDAYRAIEHAITLLPDESAFQLNRLALLEQLGRWQTIEQLFTVQPQLMHYTDARLTLAVALRHQHKSPEALNLLQPLLVSPDFSIEAESEWALNLCLCQQSDRLLAQLRQQDCSPTRLLELADYIAEESDPEVAVQLYEEVVKQQPDNAHAQHMLNAAGGRCSAEAPKGYVQALYDAHAEEFENRLQKQLEYRAPQLLAKLLTQLIESDNAELEMLDLGCGTGLCGQALKAVLPIHRLYGCDLSHSMLELAAAKKCYDQLECRDLQSALAQSGPVDLITATDVLIYTGDLHPVCQAAARALRAGGHFAFTVEAAEDDQAVSLQSSGRFRHSQSHIEAAAAVAGLHVKYCATFPLRLEHQRQLTGLMVVLERPSQAEGNNASS